MQPHLTLQQVRAKCAEGRFFAYEGWRDRLFVPPSIWLTWLFLRLGWSGNAVSVLSGVVALVGAWLMASRDGRLVVIGSFGYMLFYMLDFVDGSVARVRGQSGMGGQYVDWTMHAVSAVGTAAGLFAGALLASGPWIIPFGVLTVMTAALALDRFALGWFAVCMIHQQQRAKGTPQEPPRTARGMAKKRPFHRIFRNASTAIFHESYAIFLLPALAIAQLVLPPVGIDFRVVMMIVGGVVYFPAVLFDVWIIASEGRVDTAYRQLFFSTEVPRLPEDHFFPADGPAS